MAQQCDDSGSKPRILNKMKTSDIQIRDPFVLPVPEDQYYYLFGTTDLNCWNDEATGFDCYRSRDLENWEGPIPAFRPPADFWCWKGVKRDKGSKGTG